MKDRYWGLISLERVCGMDMGATASLSPHTIWIGNSSFDSRVTESVDENTTEVMTSKRESINCPELCSSDYLFLGAVPPVVAVSIWDRNSVVWGQSADLDASPVKQEQPRAIARR